MFLCLCVCVCVCECVCVYAYMYMHIYIIYKTSTTVRNVHIGEQRRRLLGSSHDTPWTRRMSSKRLFLSAEAHSIHSSLNPYINPARE